MTIPQLNSIKSADEARELAIDWSNLESRRPMYWSEVADWHNFFSALAGKYPELTEEFEENGIL